MLIPAPLLMAFAQDPNEAQVLHAEMLQTLLEADPLQTDFRAEAKAKGALIKTSEGKILLQKPELLYLKMESKDANKPDSVITVSDGTQSKTGDRPPKDATPGAVKNWKGI